MKTIRERTFSGFSTAAVQPYETAHRKVARRAAAEGIVLLKNEGGLLPLSPETPIGLYGAGAVKTIKGGSGSGDVNTRETVSVWEGLKNAGYRITSEDWLEDYRRRYQEARIAWRDTIWKKADEMGLTNHFFMAYATTPFIAPAGAKIEKTEADTAIYVLARTAGEGADRFNAPGDYAVSETEMNDLRALSEAYAHVVLALNVGGIVDLSVLDEIGNIDAVLYIHQGGMEAGNAFADVLSGKTVPSGKLTDTFALRYEDYPNSDTFSHNNGNVEEEVYHEDLYVGYRYFDTFEKPVRYPFGYGLSYASFSIRPMAVRAAENPVDVDAQAEMDVRVENTSSRFPGREVVQLYAACDAQGGDREYRRLVAFRKTGELAPGESETVTLRFPLRALRRYDEEAPGWVLAAGEYGLYVGSSLADAAFAAVLTLSGTDFLQPTARLCPPRKTFDRLRPDAEQNRQRYQKEKAEAGALLRAGMDLSDLKAEHFDYDGDRGDVSEEARRLVDSLSEEQLIKMATGEISKSQGGAQIGASGVAVPGAAAESSAAGLPQGIAEIVLADGPAGLRLIKEYDPEAMRRGSLPFELAVEDGFLVRHMPEKIGESRYQYCTAIPVGTLLAQTWDPEIVAACGDAVAKEMQIFGVTFWLAPGMNIHRNPLCGRNFEYFSEDPLLSGVMAAAVTDGVQKTSGMLTTIKHFACNNQEDNRNYSDSVVSERALREIYWPAFEIAVRLSQPGGLMTSYNRINGVHAANSRDLCTRLLRDEWGFRGMVMTDWGTTNGRDECCASGCVMAGNDITMPGAPEDHEDLQSALHSGKMELEDLKRAVGRLVEAVLKSERYA